MHAAESRPAPRRSAPPATPSPQPPASPPTACFHAPDPLSECVAAVASRLLLAQAMPSPLSCCEPPDSGAAPARRTRNNQPRAMQSCLERIKEEGGGAISVLRVDFCRGAVSVSKIGVVSAAAAVGNFGFAGFFRLSRSNKNE